MSLEKRLEQVLDSAEMAYSEATSARENIPDYSANESSKDSINNAESYLCDAIDDLQKLIDNIKYDQRFGGDTGADADFPHFTESLATFSKSLIEN